LSDAAPIGVGIIGLGFMGRTHLTAYAAACAAGFPCRLVAVCDARPERRRGRTAASGQRELTSAVTAPGALFDPSVVHTYADPHALLADADVELVSICTYTDTHTDLAVAALQAGKHVLVEKPVAVSSAEVRRVVEAAARAPGQLCMPALCMRFWPGWSWLKEQIDGRTFGPVRSASFQRLGTCPDWASEFYRDPARSGGALVDLHLHDADFVRFGFGDPDVVSCAGSIDHITTTYHYEHGPLHVAAEGGWDQAGGFPFRMRYVVNFAEATADFDLSRQPPLLLYRPSVPEGEPVVLPPGTGYDVEIRHLLAALRPDGPRLIASIQDALAVARLLEAERASLETGGPVPFAVG